MNVNKIIYSILFFITSVFTYAQDIDSTDNSEKANFKDRLYYGGDFNVMFGTQTFINISPRVGYKITEKLSAGIGLKYWYTSANNGSYKSSNSIYGGSIFARRNISDNLYLILEYETLNIGDALLGSGAAYWTEFLFVGAGYQQNLGGMLNINAMALYDVLYDPYINPYSAYLYPNINIAGFPIIIRLGISIGI